MIAQTDTKPGLRKQQAVLVHDLEYEPQRSGAGLINYFLFPMIAFGALAFAIAELIR
jgi:hypothetical protein